MNLEYFISSLPMLLQDRPARISPNDFAALCREQLDAPLASAVGEMLGNAPASSPHPFVAAWRDRESQIRNAIAAERARRRGGARAKPRETAGCDPSLAQGVAAAFAAKDPLSRELALDGIRWRALEDMQGINPFSEAVVLSYAGRLALNARRFSVNPDDGMERFKALTSK